MQVENKEKVFRPRKVKEVENKAKAFSSRRISTCLRGAWGGGGSTLWYKDAGNKVINE
jgi:hypothetical protein